MIGTVSGVAPDEQITPVAPIGAFYGNHAELLHGDGSGPPVARASVTEVPAVPETARVLCLGQNYLDHVNEIKEVGRKVPDFPNIFGRWPSTLDVHDGAVSVPPGDVGLDWEAELALIIGTAAGPSAGGPVPEDKAMDLVMGYTAFNDISARRLQKAVSQWTLGKNVDRSGPLGPEIVTADELGDPHNLAIMSRVNGTTMQDANTSLMMFNIPAALAYITQAMTIQPGDVVAMGTPAGVGAGHQPPIWMHAGDVVEVEIESIGVLRTHVE